MVACDQARFQGRDECASLYDTSFIPTTTHQGMTSEDRTLQGQGAGSLLCEPKYLRLRLSRGGTAFPAWAGSLSRQFFGATEQNQEEESLFIYCEAQARALGAAQDLPDGKGPRSTDGRVPGRQGTWTPWRLGFLDSGRAVSPSPCPCNPTLHT